MEAAELRKQLAAMERKLGSKPAGTQQPSKGDGKGARRGGGRQSWDESAGWYCMHYKQRNVGYLPSCFICFAWPQVEDPGQLKQNLPTLVTKSMIEKHLAAAMDSTAQHRLMLQTAGLAGPVRRSPSVTALFTVLQLKLCNEEQL
eukprot:4801231-Amphidinium_carterae.1